MNEGDVYELLRQAVDKLGLGFSATKTGVEIKILKRFFQKQMTGCGFNPLKNFKSLPATDFGV